MELTQKYLKSVLDYDALTGVLTWIAATRHVGKQAGAIREKSAGRESSRRVMINRKEYKADKIAMIWMGDKPEHIVHLNGDTLDDSYLNLKSVEEPQGKKSGPKRKKTELLNEELDPELQATATALWRMTA